MIFVGDRGSPILLQRSQKNTKWECVAGIMMSDNSKCFSAQGKLIAANMLYYQGRDFGGQFIGRKDESRVTQRHRLGKNFLQEWNIVIETKETKSVSVWEQVWG